MIRVKALDAGVWRTAPRTSIEVVSGHEYVVPYDLAQSLISAGKAEIAKTENKVKADYEKQSAPAREVKADGEDKRKDQR